MRTRGTARQSALSVDPSLAGLLDRAWEASRSVHGNSLSLYVPGMFVVDGKRGRYRAFSITGDQCELGCEHCKGSLLVGMAHAPDPERLVSAGLQAAERGDLGMLVTGGCDTEGRLPWERFYDAIRMLKTHTSLKITVHSGFVTPEQARGLKDCGVDQALVDIMGDDATARSVYHLARGTRAVREALDSLVGCGLEVVPHVLFGLHYGEPRGESEALRIILDYPVRKYVIVVLMPARGTPMESVRPPARDAAAEFIARARIAMPDRRCGLGCARPGGHYKRDLDRLAVWAGVNSIAFPSDAATEEALRRGLNVSWKETCCSLD